ncbi:MAG TPA: L-threonylcarbamoyladenylate synthase [bacterium]|jgi:tRNA threonylcarbamoyl adenosine modification protein (Sua5/YciO/YrdC/YwlC family)
MILKTHPDNPNIRHIRLAIDALESGELIAYATDTVYGLGCDIHSKQAMERALALKGYSKYHALSFLCADLSDISKYAHVDTPAYKVMKRALPGPFTFILPASREVPRMLLTKQQTVGIRVPDHPVCRALLKEFGRPILSTSVTSRDGELMTDPEEIENEWRHDLAVVLDSGILLPEHSTVVDLTDSDNPVILREGKGDVALIGA